ncbi:type II secretion system F family protein [Marinobacter sp. C2H3]|uniref:type II secretion system F family protein n=1 Tax=Marinobacter sp. C2H3 TaxID=3119003 RepID=UPI00300F63F9
MSQQMIWLACLMTGFGALVVMFSQLLISQWLAGSAIRKRVSRRLSAELVEEAQAPVVDLGPVENLLLRAGVKLSPARALLIAATLAVVLALVVVYRGWVEAAIALFFVITLLVTLWRVRFERQRRAIQDELPGLLDDLLRSLSVGRSVEQSVQSAFSDASAVFEAMAFRLRNAIAQGRDYTQVLDAFAGLYQVTALKQIAIALRTASRFGSSVRPVVSEVAKAIRAQQELRREFLAATAETRFTAVVFAIMPPALAVYMVVINKEFGEKLLGSDTGMTLLYIAGALQVGGIVMIWNLIRRVGRE